MSDQRPSWMPLPREIEEALEPTRQVYESWGEEWDGSELAETIDCLLLATGLRAQIEALEMYGEHKWTPATVIDHLLFRAEKAERELAELRECVRAADAMRFALFGTFGKVIAAYDAARAKVKEADRG